MNYFVNIELLYKKKENRTIEYLSNCYKNKKLLKEKIKLVAKELFDNDSILFGKKILIKPNWVLHNQKIEDTICLRTNDFFLLAALEIILEKKPSIVIIGDAPIQSCNWSEMLSKDFTYQIDELIIKYSIPIIIKDFRRVTFNPIYNNPIREKKPISDYIIFDLGKKSYLENISTEKNIFRITNYNPDRLAESHRKGIHKYCITKDLFDADIVISMPKIKTHQKTGITGALKNLVGINGDKDYLPHHRIGGSGLGGDCYPGNNILRLWAEQLLDIANRKQGKNLYYFYVFLSLFFWKATNPKKVHTMSAAWHGNDTTWRMVMDLNKIAKYGKIDGTLDIKPQRNIYSLCDGIISGQGNGPLKPDPLPLGLISFTNDSELNDISMGTLMDFDISKIPLLNTILKKNISKDKNIYLNGKYINIKELKNYSIFTVPPPGWVDHLKN